jgi:cAMP phosphodiesterase
MVDHCLASFWQVENDDVSSRENNQRQIRSVSTCVLQSPLNRRIISQYALGLS